MRINEAHCHWRWAHDCLDVFLIGHGQEVIQVGDDYRRVREIAAPVYGTSLPNDGTTPEPSMQLSPEAAQQLMDQLWQAGLRPTEGTGSAGSLAATQKHLDDMRAIVGQQLGVNLSHAIQR